MTGVVYSKCELKTFIPETKPQMVVMGTMVAICARSLNGEKPSDETFYYHNNRNHFWRVMQYLFEPRQLAQKLSLTEKKEFLNKHGVVITNLVKAIEVPNNEAKDPSDTVLFKAHKKNRIQFKRISPKFKKTLEKTPVFFTCRRKRGIENLLSAYRDYNKITNFSLDQVSYLATPTRCNPQARADMWRREIIDHLKNQSADTPLLKSLTLP